MENNIVEAKYYVKRNRVLTALIAITSAIVSLFVAGFCFSFSFKENYWFIAVAIYFILEGGSIIAPLFIKDDYKAMKFQGVSQIIGVVIFMPYLLFMILWNDANGTMDYSFLTYFILAAAAFIKAMLFTGSRIFINKDYHPMLHGYANGALITTLFLFAIIELIIVNNFYPGTTTAVFDNLLKEKPIWIYIIDIIINATLTIFAALLALSTAIRASTREELSTSNKIKHTIKWFADNEVGMFFGLIFTLYLAVLSIINMKQSFFYILLFIYYIGNVIIRATNYLLHKKIQRISDGNQIKDNRYSSWLLLLNALTYLFFSNVLVVAAIFMMIQKANVGSNIYLFLFMIIPMAIYRWITANKNIKRNRKDNNTYKLGVSLIGLVNVFFTILEVVAISCHELPIVWLRYVIIILAIIAAKISVIVVAFIFVIHWIRSMILNNRIKERRLAKQKREKEENDA